MKEVDGNEGDGADKRIEVWLVEYKACQQNRDHYDSVRWTMGSIFIATSLTLFGVSFISEIKKEFWEVCVIASFSLLLTMIWYAYNQHIDPYTLESIKRMHKIEQKLRGMDFDFELQRSVFCASRRHPLGCIRGAWITYWLVMAIIGAWFFRIWLFVPELSWKIVLLLDILPYLALAVYYLHMKKISTRNLGRELEDMHRPLKCS